jgi:hypothetical protein
MHLDLRLERALERVELVTGVGTREAGRMCVMSLVACLAGEAHGDSPATASALIRAFAIPLNDNMPHAARQRLKAFAPRIIGTADGQDAARAALLRDALATEILPRLGRHGTSRARWGGFWSVLSLLRRRRLEREAAWMMQRSALPDAAGDPARAVAAAGAVARLLSRAAREAGDPREAERLWALAIGLLDRLCEAGPVRAEPPPAMAARLEKVFAAREGRAGAAGPPPRA